MVVVDVGTTAIVEVRNREFRRFVCGDCDREDFSFNLEFDVVTDN